MIFPLSRVLRKLVAGRFQHLRLHLSHGVLASVDPQLAINSPYYSVLRAPTCWGQTLTKQQIRITLVRTDTNGGKRKEENKGWVSAQIIKDYFSISPIPPLFCDSWKLFMQSLISLGEILYLVCFFHFIGRPWELGLGYFFCFPNIWYVY